MRRWAGGIAGGLAIACGLVAGCPANPRVPKVVPPKLVVVVVVDQLPTWVFERHRALFTGGFARLLRDGAYVRAGMLPYSNSFTAPGHASIATGAPPSVHGVIGNTWYRRHEGRERAAEEAPDGLVFAVGPSQGGELSAEDAVSARALRVEGVADSLRRATRDRARSVAIALKARSAVFVTGRRPELAVWYESAAGGMTTSRAYTQAVPRWLIELERTRPVNRFFERTWEPRDAALLANATGIPDDAPGESSVHGLDTTFPHELSKSDAPARAILHTPYGDEMVLDAALAALDAMALGADDIPDLLALSFSARDYAGHLWGPDSWEALELTLRLDETLGTLFDTLDRRLGRSGWAVVLTSDHGATPVVEQSPVPGARRIRTPEIAAAVETALGRRVGPGPWVASVVSSNIYLTPAFAQVPEPARGEALTAAADAVSKIPGVAATGRVDQVTGHCAQRTGLERAVCLSVIPSESGELYVVPSRGSLISDYKAGSHHDAPFEDNREVPIFVMAPGLAAQTGSGSLLQVAPTVAALLGVPPPAAATEPPLFGIRRR